MMSVANCLLNATCLRPWTTKSSANISYSDRTYPASARAVRTSTVWNQRDACSTEAKPK